MFFYGALFILIKYVLPFVIAVGLLWFFVWLIRTTKQ